MSISTAQVPVTTTAGVVVPYVNSGVDVYQHGLPFTLLNVGAADIFVGKADVTPTTGLKVASGQSFSSRIRDNLYAITASGTATAHTFVAD